MKRLLILALLTSSAQAQNMGYYAGSAMFYPYETVYCDLDPLISTASPCWGRSMHDLPRSAPLPPAETCCVWVDIQRDLNRSWYRWRPRMVPTDKQMFYGKRLCYFEDRGEPKDISDRSGCERLGS